MVLGETSLPRRIRISEQVSNTNVQLRIRTAARKSVARTRAQAVHAADIAELVQPPAQGPILGCH